jgi:hypothetical protein
MKTKIAKLLLSLIIGLLPLGGWAGSEECTSKKCTGSASVKIRIVIPPRIASTPEANPRESITLTPNEDGTVTAANP